MNKLKSKVIEYLKELFHKNQIYAFFWIIVGGVILLLFQNWQEQFKDPDKVYVLNQKDGNDTTITIVQIAPDYKYLESLIEFQIESRKKSDLKPGEINFLDSLISKLNENIEKKIDSTEPRTLQFNRPEITVNSDPTSRGINDQVRLSILNRPIFRLPSKTKGYLHSSFNSYGSIKLISNNLKKGEDVKLEVRFVDLERIKEITPMFISILETRDNSNYVSIWEEQFKIVAKENFIYFSSNFKKGSYELIIGVYELDDLQSEYPRFYHEKFSISIY